MPLMLGFISKVVFVIFTALFKLLVLGIISLGTSGITLLVAGLVTKSDRSYSHYDRHARTNMDSLGGHVYRREQQYLSHDPILVRNYRSYQSNPHLYKAQFKHPSLMTARASSHHGVNALLPDETFVQKEEY